MLENLRSTLESLATPGAQTSEGKNTRAILILLGFLLLIEVGFIFIERTSSTGAWVTVAGTLLAMIAKSSIYTKARSQVKGRIVELLGNPGIVELLRDGLTPPAPAPKLQLASVYQPNVEAAAAPVPLKPRELVPHSPFSPVLPPTGGLKAGAPVREVERYAVVLTYPDGTVRREYADEATRQAACVLADSLRHDENLPEGTKVHVQ